MRQGTRTVLLTVCLGAAVVMLLNERQKTGQLSDDLADLNRRTTSQVSELQQQISDARTKADGLDAALSQAREQLGRKDDQHRSDEATSTDIAAKLQAERQQAAGLADRLAGTERRSAAQATELQQRIETEQGKTARLDRDLGETRRQLAKTEELQRSAEASARDAESSSQSNQQKAAALADKLADMERTSTAETKHLQERFEAEHARASGLEVDLVDALKLAQAAKSADNLASAGGRSSGPSTASEADRRPLASQTPAPALPQSMPEPSAQAAVPAPELASSGPPSQTQAPESPQRVPPDDVPARVVLHYAYGSESAKARAQFAELLLQEQGLHIEDHASPAKGVSASKVTFFYKEDQAIAKTIADTLARITGSDTVLKPPMSLKSLPRPGTIEVAISG